MHKTESSAYSNSHAIATAKKYPAAFQSDVGHQVWVTKAVAHGCTSNGGRLSAGMRERFPVAFSMIVGKVNIAWHASARRGRFVRRHNVTRETVYPLCVVRLRAVLQTAHYARASNVS